MMSMFDSLWARVLVFLYIILAVVTILAITHRANGVVPLIVFAVIGGVTLAWGRWRRHGSGW